MKKALQLVMFLMMFLILLVTVAFSQSYQLSVADAANRTTNARALNGATLSGNEYVFTSPNGSTASNPSNVQSVSFWLDNIPMKGKATSSDWYTPFDYNNTVAAFTTPKKCSGNNGTATVTCVFSNTTSGDSILISVLYPNGSTISSLTGTNNTYTAIASACVGASMSLNTYYSKNIHGGAETVTAVMGSLIGGGPIIFGQENSGILGPPTIDISGSGSACASGKGTSLSVSGNTIYGKELIYAAAACSGTCTGSGTVQNTLNGSLSETKTTMVNEAVVLIASQTPSANWAMQLSSFVATTTVSPWNTVSVTNGTHTLTQVVTKISGGTETDTATFTINNGASHYASMDWTAGQSGTLTYSVYRSTTSGSNYNRIASGLSATSYTDNTVVGGTTYYYVATETYNGQESGYSNQITAVIP